VEDMSWKVGDIAILICVRGLWKDPELQGTEVELIKYLGDVPSKSFPGTITRAWEVETILGLKRVAERVLRPLPPPNEVTSWEDSVFKPRELIDA